MTTPNDHPVYDLTKSVPPVCWQRERQTACLRLELPSGETHIVAYTHFLTAYLQPAKNTQNPLETLCISFSAYAVEIDGRGLRELLLALEDLAVKWIRTMPERYRCVLGGDFGVISEIRITALASEK